MLLDKTNSLLFIILRVCYITGQLYPLNTDAHCMHNILGTLDNVQRLTKYLGKGLKKKGKSSTFCG